LLAFVKPELLSSVNVGVVVARLESSASQRDEVVEASIAHGLDVYIVSLRLAVFLPVLVSVFVSVYVSVCLPVYMSFSLFLTLSGCPSCLTSLCFSGSFQEQTLACERVACLLDLV